MSTASPARAIPGSGRLSQIARRTRPTAPGGDAPERCGLCAEPVPDRHRHVLDRDTGVVECACQACGLLFDREAAGGGHYALVPDDRRLLDGFRLDGPGWDRLGVPVGLAYFVARSRDDAVVVAYPSPGGLVEAEVDDVAWSAVVDANPVLATLRPDVEGLLVHRIADADEQWLVPVEDCYRLIARFRTHWRGMHGGDEVWVEIGRFFDDLRATAVPVAARPDHEPGEQEHR